MLKKRSFWIGILIGFWIGFLYGWLGIWTTYTELEREHRQREAELGDIKRIIYSSEDILRQRKEILEWNLQNIKPVPEWVEAEEEDT